MGRIRTSALCGLTLMVLAGSPPNAAAQEPFLGEIRWVAFDFVPNGWADCNGQLLPISANTALFSLIGFTYGGDGVTTFALPDMRGRMPVGDGQGPGLTNRTLGETGGRESVTLTPAEMPAHTHDLKGSYTEASSTSPNGNVPATKARVTLYNSGPADATMNPSAIGQAGSGAPHENMAPFLALNCIIAVEGIYPCCR